MRVGLWYSVKSLTGQVTISLRSDKVNRADPVVLAEYVVALLVQDKTREDLKETCLSQLEDFLSDGEF